MGCRGGSSPHRNLSSYACPGRGVPLALPRGPDTRDALESERISPPPINGCLRLPPTGGGAHLRPVAAIAVRMRGRHGLIGDRLLMLSCDYDATKNAAKHLEDNFGVEVSGSPTVGRWDREGSGPRDRIPGPRSQGPGIMDQASPIPDPRGSGMSGAPDPRGRGASPRSHMGGGGLQLVVKGMGVGALCPGPRDGAERRRPFPRPCGAGRVGDSGIPPAPRRVTVSPRRPCGSPSTSRPGPGLPGRSPKHIPIFDRVRSTPHRHLGSERVVGCQRCARSPWLSSITTLRVILFLVPRNG